jgi:D-ribose pyranose/furanose isomerase RbsD
MWRVPSSQITVDLSLWEAVISMLEAAMRAISSFQINEIAFARVAASNRFINS